MHLRLGSHLAELRLNDQNSHPDVVGRFLYFLASYILLLVVSFFFHRKSITAQLSFPIYPLPGVEPQNLIYYLVILFLGIIGAFSAIGNYWTAYDWILYAMANILLALYVFLYQLSSQFTLLITSIAAILLAIDLQWLFIETSDMNEGIQEEIIRNFVGAVGAWALIYALITLGQLFVHTIGVHKKFQSFCFVITSILLLAGIAYWNLASSYCRWSELIGFIAVGSFLIIFTVLNVQRNSELDIDNLLS